MELTRERPEEAVGSTRAELQVVVRHLICLLELNLGPLGGKQVLHPTEPP